MAWIESHTVLMRHRKLADLARALRLRRSYALGHLHALWHAALEQAEDGDLSAWSDEFIAEQADFAGDAPQFVRLLQEHGFLGYRDAQGQLVAGTEKLIHDWPDYVGKWLTSRYSSSNRDKLVAIWAKHQRVYGEQSANKPKGGREKKASGKRDGREKDSITPNPPDLTNQTNQTTPEELRLLLDEFKKLNSNKVPVGAYETTNVQDEILLGLISAFGLETLKADLKDVAETGQQYPIGWFIPRWQNKGWERKDGSAKPRKRELAY